MTTGGRSARFVLLVEGIDEQYALPWLLEAAGIAWPDKAPPVKIVNTKSASELLDRGALEAELNSPGLEALGLVVDADRDLAARWDSVRNSFTTLRASFPETLDPAGLVHDSEPRIGVWIMPDNIREGMLETLLNDVRTGDRQLHDHAATASAAASSLGAPFKAVHQDKVLLHTWLAWQDPPGQALGTAAKARALNASAPAFLPFVAWFRRLYRL